MTIEKLQRNVIYFNKAPNLQHMSLFCFPLQDDGKVGEKEVAMDTDDEMEDPERWTMEEKEKLLHFVTKIFLLNFPSYMAYKHMYHSSLEVSKRFLIHKYSRSNVCQSLIIHVYICPSMTISLSVNHAFDPLVCMVR